MPQLIRSLRLYLWPVILANTLAMSSNIGSNLSEGSILGISLCFCASYGFLINDLWDRNVDRVNRSGRLEESDRQTLIAAFVSACMLITGALIASSYVCKTATHLILMIAIALTLYTILLRKVFLISTLTAAILSASPLWMPLIGHQVRPFHVTVVISMIIMLFARETILDVKDIKGDIAGKRRTLPVLYGTHAAKWVSAILILIASIILFSIIFLMPFPFEEKVLIYMPACLLVYLMLLPSFQLLRESSDNLQMRRYILTSRFGMLIIPFLLVIEGLMK